MNSVSDQTQSIAPTPSKLIKALTCLSYMKMKERVLSNYNWGVDPSVHGSLLSSQATFSKIRGGGGGVAAASIHCQEIPPLLCVW